MNIRRQIAAILIHLAAKVYQGDGPGFCFVRNLFGGWVVINESLIRQTVCHDKYGLKNGFQWEAWSLPEEYQKDFLAMSKKRD